MNTLRERILASAGLAPVAVPCPEWGEDVVVHGAIALAKATSR